MKRVAIVGGGFSGLASGFFLSQSGHQVTVLEKSSEVGGLIRTLSTPAGLVETAANGFLNSALWESVFEALGLSLTFPSRHSRARYIFRSGLRRWPLGYGETLGLVIRLVLRLIFSKASFRPEGGETIEQWGRRVLGLAATRFLLIPGLGGIYAGDPGQMSASLIIGSFAKKARSKPRKRGLASGEKGMGQVLEAFAEYIKKNGGQIHTGRQVLEIKELLRDYDHVVLACGPHGAAELLKEMAPGTAQKLSQITGLPILSVALGFPAETIAPKGFGVLFPRDQGIRALGSLFSSCIFEGRSRGRLETWIYGGGTDPEILDLSDSFLIEQVVADRMKVLGHREEPTFTRIQRWPISIPHYDLNLERILASPLALPDRVRLVGNYLGGIGLSKILEQAKQLSQEIDA